MTTNNVLNTKNPSGVSSGSYTNASITVNAAGLLTVAANGTSGITPILARVYPSTTQSIGTSATQLQYDSVSFDTGGFWNTGTYKFLPTTAGYYQVTAVNEVSAPASIGQYTMYIYKNVTVVSAGFTYQTVASSTISIIARDIIFLNGSTDYITISALCHATSTCSNNGGTQSFATFAYLGN